MKTLKEKITAGELVRLSELRENLQNAFFKTGLQTEKIISLVDEEIHAQSIKLIARTMGASRRLAEVTSYLNDPEKAKTGNLTGVQISKLDFWVKYLAEIQEDENGFYYPIS